MGVTRAGGTGDDVNDIVTTLSADDAVGGYTAVGSSGELPAPSFALSRCRNATPENGTLDTLASSLSRTAPGDDDRDGIGDGEPAASLAPTPGNWCVSEFLRRRGTQSGIGEMTAVVASKTRAS